MKRISYSTWIIDLYFAWKCSFQYLNQGNQEKNWENNRKKIIKRTKIKGRDRKKSQTLDLGRNIDPKKRTNRDQK